MARFETFDRDLRIATADLEPAAINSALARFARQEVAKAVASGAGSAQYETYVNGQQGAAEETVKAPGPIVYEFAWWKEVIEAALAELIARSPRRSGRYTRSFVVVVGGRTVITEFSRLRADAEVVIFNAQPYSRKIETGAVSFSVSPGHFRSARAAVSRRFGNSFRVESKFINVPSGIHPLAPYQLRRSSGRGKGRQPGDRLTYPALIINMV